MELPEMNSEITLGAIALSYQKKMNWQLLTQQPREYSLQSPPLLEATPTLKIPQPTRLQSFGPVAVTRRPTRPVLSLSAATLKLPSLLYSASSQTVSTDFKILLKLMLKLSNTWKSSNSSAYSA